MRSQADITEEAKVDADPDDQLAELRQRVAALERHTMTLTAALDWFGRWDSTAGEPVTSLRAARITTGLAALAEEGSGAGLVFDRAGDGADLVIHPDLARFLMVAERTRVGQVTAALARRLMLAPPVSAAGRHKLLALADALERLCTSAGVAMMTSDDPVLAILEDTVDPAPGCRVAAARDLLRDENLSALTLDGDGDDDRDLVIREAQSTVIVEFLYELVGETPEVRRAEDQDNG
jgi:hypothetical protein